MSWTEDALAEAYRRRSREGRESEDCPAPETWIALAAGDSAEKPLSKEARRAAVEHLGGCAECGLELRTLRELRPWAEQQAEALGPALGPAPKQAKETWMDLLRWWLRDHSRAVAAASVVLLTGVLVLRILLTAGPEVGLGPLRGPGESQAGLFPADGAELAASPPRFAWPAQAGAERYRVRLFRADAEEIWASPWQPETEIVLAEDLFSALPRGEPILWTVDAAGAGASQRLGPYRFTLR